MNINVNPPANTQGVPPANKPSLKMNTNATPFWQKPEAQVQELPPAAQNLSQTNTNEASENLEDTKPLSPQFAALAKQRRALQVKERELAEKEKALQGAGQQSVDLARLKSDPLRVLLENGVTYDQLTDAVLKNNQNSEFYTLKAEMDTLKQSVDQKLLEREQQQEQQVLSEMKREAAMLASQNPEFELVRITNSVPDVVRLIEKNYRQTGEVLTVQEAMRLVETELLKDAQKIAASKKLQSQNVPPQAQMQKHSGMRTLTNNHTASVPMSAKQRAIAAFYGQLK